MANSEFEIVRQLLLSNLIDESGNEEKFQPSHLELLDRCLRSCGVKNICDYMPTKNTKDIEEWFFNSFYKGNTYESLCILGPGTESISQIFLDPLENSIKRVFSANNPDLSYFDAHRPEVEGAHAQDLAKAIAYIEMKLYNNKNELFDELKKQKIEEALSYHGSFWEGLRLKYQNN